MLDGMHACHCNVAARDKAEYALKANHALKSDSPELFHESTRSGAHFTLSLLPRPSKTCTTWACPASDARWSGVLPCQSSALDQHTTKAQAG